jgi:hypothetical protein
MESQRIVTDGKILIGSKIFSKNPRTIPKRQFYCPPAGYIFVVNPDHRWQPLAVAFAARCV